MYVCECECVCTYETECVCVCVHTYVRIPPTPTHAHQISYVSNYEHFTIRLLYIYILVVDWLYKYIYIIMCRVSIYFKYLICIKFIYLYTKNYKTENHLSSKREYHS